MATDGNDTANNAGPYGEINPRDGMVCMKVKIPGKPKE